jgi:hypothetical protein
MWRLTTRLQALFVSPTVVRSVTESRDAFAGRCQMSDSHKKTAANHDLTLAKNRRLIYLISLLTYEDSVGEGLFHHEHLDVRMC